jgi:phosphate transport system permease protein
MATAELASEPRLPAVARPPRESTASWPLVDRLGYCLCLATGIRRSPIAPPLDPLMLATAIDSHAQSGGFSDAIRRTCIVTAIGIAIAAPTGIALAAWLSEYARPTWLARAVESAIEMLAGAPSVVLALFGLVIFSQGFLGFLSPHAENGAVTGQSFLTAGAVMSILAVPLIAASTREALALLPDRLREASYALGKTRATTTRRVLLPAIRPSISSGVVLGMGRIIGDTAIITLVLGLTQRIEPIGKVPLLGALRGTGSTLTSYVYSNSPAGEGNSPDKAYAAAFVLLMTVLALNALVTRLTGGGERRTGRWRTSLAGIGRRLRWTR